MIDFTNISINLTNATLNKGYECLFQSSNEILLVYFSIFSLLYVGSLIANNFLEFLKIGFRIDYALIVFILSLAGYFTYYGGVDFRFLAKLGILMIVLAMSGLLKKRKG